MDAAGASPSHGLKKKPSCLGRMSRNQVKQRCCSAMGLLQKIAQQLLRVSLHPPSVRSRKGKSTSLLARVLDSTRNRRDRKVIQKLKITGHGAEASCQMLVLGASSTWPLLFFGEVQKNCQDDIERRNGL